MIAPNHAGTRVRGGRKMKESQDNSPAHVPCTRTR